MRHTGKHRGIEKGGGGEISTGEKEKLRRDMRGGGMANFGEATPTSGVI